MSLIGKFDNLLVPRSPCMTSAVAANDLLTPPMTIMQEILSRNENNLD